MNTKSYAIYKCKPTIVPAGTFNAREDAENIHEGLKTSNKKMLTEIVTNRGLVQRLEIAESFKTMYGKDLIEEFTKKLSGEYQEVMVALMTPLPQYYANALRNAMVGLGTDEDCIIEILCTLSNYGVKTITAFYEKSGRKLEDDIKDDTSGHFRRLLVSLLQAGRDDNQTIDKLKAEEDAKALYEAGVKKWGTEESVFNKILVTRSYQQLRQTFLEYELLSGHDIETAIKGEFSGDILNGFLALVRCVKDKIGFFADKLYASMKGLGTDDRTLIRIIVCRSEIDLGDIKEAFLAKYNKSLEKWIEGDTSGEYKAALLSIVSTE